VTSEIGGQDEANMEKKAIARKNVPAWVEETKSLRFVGKELLDHPPTGSFPMDGREGGISMGKRSLCNRNGEF